MDTAVYVLLRHKEEHSTLQSQLIMIGLFFYGKGGEIHKNFSDVSFT